MSKKIPADPLAGRIFTPRGQRVILDSDLACLYGVATKRCNEAVQRNASRVPTDFALRLYAREFDFLRSQIATVETADSRVRSAGDRRGRHRRYLPWVFPERGAVMAANVLRSPTAVQMSVYVVHAFVAQREALATNQSVLRRLAEVD